MKKKMIAVACLMTIASAQANDFTPATGNPPDYSLLDWNFFTTAPAHINANGIANLDLIPVATGAYSQYSYIIATPQNNSFVNFLSSNGYRPELSIINPAMYSLIDRDFYFGVSGAFDMNTINKFGSVSAVNGMEAEMNFYAYNSGFYGLSNRIEQDNFFSLTSTTGIGLTSLVNQVKKRVSFEGQGLIFKDIMFIAHLEAPKKIKMIDVLFDSSYASSEANIDIENTLSSGSVYDPNDKLVVELTNIYNLANGTKGFKVIDSTAASTTANPNRVMDITVDNTYAREDLRAFQDINGNIIDGAGNILHVLLSNGNYDTAGFQNGRFGYLFVANQKLGIANVNNAARVQNISDLIDPTLVKLKDSRINSVIVAGSGDLGVRVESSTGYLFDNAEVLNPTASGNGLSTSYTIPGNTSYRYQYVFGRSPDPSQLYAGDTVVNLKNAGFTSKVDTGITGGRDLFYLYDVINPNDTSSLYGLAKSESIFAPNKPFLSFYGPESATLNIETTNSDLNMGQIIGTERQTLSYYPAGSVFSFTPDNYAQLSPDSEINVFGNKTVTFEEIYEVKRLNADTDIAFSHNRYDIGQITLNNTSLNIKNNMSFEPFAYAQLFNKIDNPNGTTLNINGGTLSLGGNLFFGANNVKNGQIITTGNSTIDLSRGLNALNLHVARIDATGGNNQANTKTDLLLGAYLDGRQNAQANKITIGQLFGKVSAYIYNKGTDYGRLVRPEEVIVFDTPIAQQVGEILINNLTETGSDGIEYTYTLVKNDFVPDASFDTFDYSTLSNTSYYLTNIGTGGTNNNPQQPNIPGGGSGGTNTPVVIETIGSDIPLLSNKNAISSVQTRIGLLPKNQKVGSHVWGDINTSKRRFNTHHRETSSIVFGVDNQVNESLLVGGFIDYSKGNFHSKDLTKGDSSSYGLGLYFNKDFDNDVYLSGITRFAKNKLKYDTLDGDYKANSMSVDLELGKTFKNKDLDVTPYIAYNYTQVKGFTLSESSILAWKTPTLNVNEQRLGVNLKMAENSYNPYLDVAYVNTRGIKPFSDNINDVAVRVGFNKDLNDKFNVSANIETRFSKLKENKANFMISYKW